MIFPSSVGWRLSRRKHLPVLLMYDADWSIFQLPELLWRIRSWERIEETPEYAVWKIGEYRIKLIRKRDPRFHSPSYTRTTIKNYGKWSHQYKPPFDLTGKTVLDAGSGVGETALYFFNHGAAKVIAVDLNPHACEAMRENAEMNNWDVEIHNEPFTLKHLKLGWDFAKVDVEGGEACLLELPRLPDKPMAIETHGVVTARFRAKFGEQFHQVERESELCTIWRNYL